MEGNRQENEEQVTKFAFFNFPFREENTVKNFYYSTLRKTANELVRAQHEYT
jgi:hypothetical protein